MKSSAPASMPCNREARSVSAVSITMGTSASTGSMRRVRHTSNPSMPGSITSSRIRSGEQLGGQLQALLASRRRSVRDIRQRTRLVRNNSRYYRIVFDD